MVGGLKKGGGAGGKVTIIQQSIACSSFDIHPFSALPAWPASPTQQPQWFQRSRGGGDCNQWPPVVAIIMNVKGWNIGQMSDQNIMDEFERMLENMNLTEEKKVRFFLFHIIYVKCNHKEPLRMLPISKKREMLTMNSKTVARNRWTGTPKKVFLELFPGSTPPPTTFSTWVIPNWVCRRSTVASKGGCRNTSFDHIKNVEYYNSLNASVWE